MVSGICVGRECEYPEYGSVHDQRSAGYALEFADTTCYRRYHRSASFSVSRDCRSCLDFVDPFIAWYSGIRRSFELADTCDYNRSGFVSSKRIFLII